jgi:kinesin family member 5
VVESTSNDAGEVHNLLQNETMLRQSAEDEANDLKNQVSHWKKMEVLLA